MLEFRHIQFKRYFKTTPLRFDDVITNFFLTYTIEQKYYIERLHNYIPFWTQISENVLTMHIESSSN